MPAKTNQSSSMEKPSLQAERMRRTRKAHSKEIAEDYVEAIADLIETEGEARVTELARRLGVTHVTVNRTVARLQESGFVTTQPYRSIFLTNEGHSLAKEAKMRHQTVVEFLKCAGVPEAAAKRDAEGIEHHVSPDTLKAFKRFIRRSKTQSP